MMSLMQVILTVTVIKSMQAMGPAHLEMRIQSAQVTATIVSRLALRTTSSMAVADLTRLRATLATTRFTATVTSLRVPALLAMTAFQVVRATMLSLAKMVMTRSAATLAMMSSMVVLVRIQ